MADPDRPLDVERIVTALDRREAEYLVVGGIAAILHGWPGATADLDLVGPPDAGNLDRLAVALADLSASAPGWDGSAQGLARHNSWPLATDAGPIDLMFVLEPWGTYEELRPNAEEVLAFGLVIPVVSLDELIELKRSLGRPKDLRVAVELDEMRWQRGS